MAAVLRLNRWAPTCALLGVALCGGCSQAPVPTTPTTETTAVPVPAVPNFAGTWTGDWIASTCTNSPPPFDGYAAWCYGLLYGPGGPTTPNGYELPFRFDLAQNGPTVSGTIRRPSLDDPPPQVVTGSIDSSGDVTLTETYSITTGPPPVSVETDVTTWSLHKATDGSLYGSVMIRRDLTNSNLAERQVWAQATGDIVASALTAATSRARTSRQPD